MKSRKSTIKRSTQETSITVSVNLDGTGKTDIQTGINFLDHLIVSFGKHEPPYAGPALKTTSNTFI